MTAANQLRVLERYEYLFEVCLTVATTALLRIHTSALKFVCAVASSYDTVKRYDTVATSVATYHVMG